MTNYSGFTFPIETDNEAEHLWALAQRLAAAAPPDELPMALQTAFALAVQLHAAQKLAHANEMREAQESRLADRMGEVADALNRIAVAIKEHGSEPDRAGNSHNHVPAPARPRRSLNLT